MKKLFVLGALLLAPLVGFAQSATSTATSTDSMATTTSGMASSSPVSIMVMKHVCNSNIKSVGDLFGGYDSSSVAGVVHAELSCPTTALPGNEPLAGTVNAPRMNFNFLLNWNDASSTAMVNGLSQANYVQYKICGDQIMSADPSYTEVASTTCLDASHYMWTVNATGTLSVMEEAPSGYHFGTVLFTPTALMNNNDASALVSVSSSTITLDPSVDTDKMIMLHVLNFADATSTGTTTPPTDGQGTTTPPVTGTTTPPTSGEGTSTPPSGSLDSSTLQVIMNAIQRIEDIQDRLIDLLFQLANH